MDRKKALVTAGAVSGTLLAASTAFAFTGGLLDPSADDGAGSLTPVAVVATTAAPSPTVAPVPGAVGTAPAAPSVVAPSTPPVTRSEASGTVRAGGDDDDRGGSGSEYESEAEDGPESHEDEEHEYEGADDDD